MSDLLVMTRQPRSIEDVLAAIGLTDCDLDATARDDGTLLQALGITRAVQRHRPYSNAPVRSATADGFATRFVIDAVPSDPAALRELHTQGVRGVRCALTHDGSSIAAIQRDADRIAPLDWHVEIVVGDDLSVLARHEWELLQLPVALCLTDITAAVARLGIEDENVGLLLDLLHVGRTWIKLGGAIAYDELRGFVNAALAVRSDRVLWGSSGDEPIVLPSDHARQVATRLAILERLIPDEDDRAAVLIENPARLYGFEG